MYFSKYNIFSKIRNSDNYFIVNLLSGNADILSPDDAKKVNTILTGEISSEDDFSKELSEKGYLLEEAEEKKLYKNKYLDFIDSRDEDEIQLFFVPNYTCNFACSYCYQNEYTNQNSSLDIKITEAFFQYIKTTFHDRKKYITLFGGEPLLSSPDQKELIRYFLYEAARVGLEVCIVTNGYTLCEYIDLLKLNPIREVQVTLDGTTETHNGRRFLKNGTGTFEKIVKGIDACLENNITVNLRMVVDKDNIENLPEFANFAIEKRWTKSRIFKTQLGRNYELHFCQSASDKLFDRISLYEKIFDLAQQHPQILEFYKPAYSISRFLNENGSLPSPLFDSCPACKTEWAFDYTGHIYPCTATVGKADESLGMFYPVTYRNEEQIGRWESRDVTSIPECRECNLQLACGGGCASVAKNKSGKICSTDCRPIKELLELGFASYFKE
jgi:uncharacterized protein